MTGVPPGAVTAALQRTASSTAWRRAAVGGLSREEIITAALDAAAPAFAAAGRDRVIAVLGEHYLAGVNCDGANERDNAMCGCSLVNLGWHPSAGEARQAWIDHVAGLLGGDPP